MSFDRSWVRSVNRITWFVNHFCRQKKHLIRKTCVNIWVSVWLSQFHYSDVIMGAMASQITSLTIVYSTVYSGADQRKHQSSASLAFVRGIHRGPVNSPHEWPVTRKMFQFDGVTILPLIEGKLVDRIAQLDYSQLWCACEWNLAFGDLMVIIFIV